MSEAVRYGLLFFIMLVTHFQEGVTGFGGSALALPFVLALVGLDTAKKVLVMQAWVVVLYIVLVSHKRIEWPGFFGVAVPTLIGLQAGKWMADSVPEHQLKWVLAVFMLGIGIHGVRTRCNRNAPTPPPLKPLQKGLLGIFLPLGGIIHGAFGSGGPLVVIYATRVFLDKSIFRVTLCLLWLTMNSMLLGEWMLRGDLSPKVIGLSAWCLPFTVVGMVVGDFAHHRMDEIIFRRIVYIVLALAGTFMIWSLMR